MATKVDLDGLIEFIGVHWPYDDANYRDFSKLDEKERRNFIVKHSVLHMMKSVAKIAAESEKADHGAKLDEQQARIAIAKLLVNTLKLAHALGMTAEKLEDLAQSIVRTE